MLAISVSTVYCVPLHSMLRKYSYATDGRMHL